LVEVSAPPVSKRRVPPPRSPWQSDPIAKVLFQQHVTGTTKPHSSAPPPPHAYSDAASSRPGAKWSLSRAASSGNERQVRANLSRGGSCSADAQYQPMCDQSHEPVTGECGSLPVSECRWWWLWCELHQMGPRCHASEPSRAMANWKGRLVRYERCEK